MNVSGILDNMLNNYDKRLRPNFGGKKFLISACVVRIFWLSFEYDSAKLPNLNKFYESRIDDNVYLSDR